MAKLKKASQKKKQPFHSNPFVKQNEWGHFPFDWKKNKRKRKRKMKTASAVVDFADCKMDAILWLFFNLGSSVALLYDTQLSGFTRKRSAIGTDTIIQAQSVSFGDV